MQRIANYPQIGGPHYCLNSLFPSLKGLFALLYTSRISLVFTIFLPFSFSPYFLAWLIRRYEHSSIDISHIRHIHRVAAYELI